MKAQKDAEKEKRRSKGKGCGDGVDRRGEKKIDATYGDTKVRGRGSCGARGLWDGDSSKHHSRRENEDVSDRYNSYNRYDSEDEKDWLHDKYNSDEDEPLPAHRPLPPGYRPPKPKWVSRAGGVAIMRSNAVDSEDEYDMR